MFARNLVVPLTAYSVVGCVGAPALAGQQERVLHHEVVIEAPLDVVWRAWTTVEGLRPISRASRIELIPGGRYEWFLDLEPDERGRRGSEGSRIVYVVAERELVFDWTFPPDTPGLRRAGATTLVTVRFEPLTSGVRVRLTASGWQSGDEWEQGYRYFDAAWGRVLELMKRRLEARS